MQKIVRASDGALLLDPDRPDALIASTDRKVWWIHETDLARCRGLWFTLTARLGLEEMGRVPNRFGWYRFAEPVEQTETALVV